MRSAIKTCFGILCCLSALATERASALDKQLDLEPPETMTDYGYGYNSISRTHMLKSCVTFGTARVNQGGASGDDLLFSSVTTNNQLANEMGLSVSAKFSMSMGVASMSTSAKVKFFQDTKTNVMTQTILASWHGVDPISYISGDITLKPEYLKLVGTPAFREKCGDYVVTGMQSGRWLYGTVQLTVKDTTTESQLAASGAVDAEGGGVNAAAGVATVEKMKAASASQDLKIRMTTSGSSSAALTIDEFIKKTKKFPDEDGPKQIYKLKAVPYEQIVANWPTTADPLAPLTAADKLDIVAQAAWGLMALIDDTNFVTQHAALFALGTTPAKREARTTYIKNRRKLYQAELDAMRASAKNCDVDWNSDPACEALYKKWNTWVDFALAEYSHFPVRYMSDCYKARDVTLAGQSMADTLNGAVANAGNFRLSKGDRELGEFPLGVRAYLDFKPNFTGGDASAATKLRATLSMSVSENSGDKSTFAQEVSADVADLALGDLSDGAPVTLGQCSYAGSGVKADLVTTDPAMCDKMFKPFGVSAAAVAPLINACKAEALAQKHHGIQRAQVLEWSGDMHSEALKAGSGVLGSMRCMFNLSGDNHNVNCSNIGLKAVQFYLVNKEDVVADKWVAPPPTLNPRAKAAMKSAYSSVVGRTTTPKPAPVLAPAPAPTTVKRLVRPALKR